MAAWTWLIPALSFGLLVLAALAGVGNVLAVLCGIGLMAAVIAAVHHAEVIAHRGGEPFGTLVLAIAITVIEASLVLSMMIAGGEHTAVLPRDTIYAGDDLRASWAFASSLGLRIAAIVSRRGRAPASQR
jgi:Ca2+:H+ antiporter